MDHGRVNNLEGKLIVVTGGGSGIAAACARLYSGRGARVVVADRDIDAAERVAEEISGLAMFVDVSAPASITSLADRIEADQGSVDGVLTSARVLSGNVSRLEDWDSDWDRFFEVIVRGTFFTATTFGTRMARRGRGIIVTIGSVLAYLRVAAVTKVKDGKAIVARIREAGWFDDPLFGHTRLRVDGIVEHAMYLAQVKQPNESKDRWDYYRYSTPSRPRMLSSQCGIPGARLLTGDHRDDVGLSELNYYYVTIVIWLSRDGLGCRASPVSGLACSVRLPKTELPVLSRLTSRML